MRSYKPNRVVSHETQDCHVGASIVGNRSAPTVGDESISDEAFLGIDMDGMIYTVYISRQYFFLIFLISSQLF